MSRWPRLTAPSLSMLKRYPLTRIKIDRSFVSDICDDAGDAAIVRAIVQLAHGLRIDVIAEGVETVAQRDAIRSPGCDAIQGYLFGRPIPLADLQVRQNKSRAAAA